VAAVVPGGACADGLNHDPENKKGPPPRSGAAGLLLALLTPTGHGGKYGDRVGGK